MKHITTILTIVMLSAGALALRAQETSTPPADITAPTQDPGGVVYVIPIYDMIEPALLYVVRRGVTEAQQAGARAIVLTMNTPGGRVDATEEIVHTLLNVPITTYTLIEQGAFSAGAIISMATDHIYMAPGSVIGAATPLIGSPTGGAEELPESVQEKMESAVAALMRSTAQQKGHDDKLAEAMVRRKVEYKIGEKVISKEGELLTLTNLEAEELVGEGDEQRKLLSDGTVKNIDELLQAIGLENCEVVRLEVTQAERVARMIAAVAPFLLMAGMAGLWIEIKTPGFGLPGMLGALCLALFFWGHHIAGLAGLEDVIIFAVGIGFLLAEVFVLPGFGIAGVTGILLVSLALFKAMIQHYPGGPMMPPLDGNQVAAALRTFSGAVLGTIVIGTLAARFLPHSPLASRIVLSEATKRKDGYDASSKRREIELLGQAGITLSDLHPSGTARFGDRKVDVVTRGEYVESGKSIKVIDVHGNRTVVAEA